MVSAFTTLFLLSQAAPRLPGAPDGLMPPTPGLSPPVLPASCEALPCFLKQQCVPPLAGAAIPVRVAPHPPGPSCGQWGCEAAVRPGLHPAEAAHHASGSEPVLPEEPGRAMGPLPPPTSS